MVKNSLHIVMLPYLAFGHIIPFLRLAGKISARRPNIKISILSAPSNIPRISAFLPTAEIVPLEIPAVEGLPIGADITADITPAMAELLKLALDLMKPHISSLLVDLSPDLVFFDFAYPWLPSIAAPLGVKTLFFSVFPAVSTAYLTVPARRNDHQDLCRPPSGFPPSSPFAGGVPAYQAADFRYVFTSFGGGPSIFERVLACLEGCTAIVARTCAEMEGPYIEYVESQFQKPMLLAGPVVPVLPRGELEASWAEWLDGFPEGSVVFCSFGSEAFLSDDAIKELVLGIEMTGSPFLVVLNFPKEKETNSKVEKTNWRAKLPEGFEERVRGRGRVERGWVQQQHILNHRSVGCFVSHVGLSSAVEGAVAGCRLVMLPHKADQFLNATVIAEELKAGVVVERDAEDGGFRREWVLDAVRKAMADEGGELREGHRRWRDFLLDEELQNKFMESFVDKLEELAEVSLDTNGKFKEAPLFDTPGTPLDPLPL